MQALVSLGFACSQSAEDNRPYQEAGHWYQCIVQSCSKVHVSDREFARLFNSGQPFAAHLGPTVYSACRCSRGYRSGLLCLFSENCV